MKILMLGWELPPHNSGGLGVACYQLSQALVKKGADIDFVLPYEADHDIKFMNVVSGVKQNALTFQDELGAYDSNFYSVRNLSQEKQLHLYEEAVSQLVLENEYDVVHAHDWLTFRAALRARELKTLPIIVHVHSIERDRAAGNPGNPFVREIEELGLLLADKIIAVSEFTKKAIIADYGIPPEKIEVVHNSVDSTQFALLDENNAYQYLLELKQAGYGIVSSIGRLTIQKGLPNLLHAAKEVIARVPKTIFLIVGAGEQYFELIQLAAELGISKNVIFTGFLRGKQWRDSFAIADLFVLPSVSEPFGITPLEAIGYGTPTQITYQSGVSEVLHNALKIDYWDVNQMANQITAVMQSKGLRQDLLENSTKELYRLSWEASADKLMRLYRQQAAGVAA